MGSVGCYTDNTARALASVNQNVESLTVEYCASVCVGYTYFGVEAGMQCFCGNDILSNGIGGLPTTDDQCNWECWGDSAEICGGWWTISIYTYTTNSGLTTNGDVSISSAESSSYTQILEASLSSSGFSSYTTNLETSIISSGFFSSGSIHDTTMAETPLTEEASLTTKFSLITETISDGPSSTIEIMTQTSSGPAIEKTIEPSSNAPTNSTAPSSIGILTVTSLGAPLSIIDSTAKTSRMTEISSSAPLSSIESPTGPVSGALSPTIASISSQSKLITSSILIPQKTSIETSTASSNTTTASPSSTNVKSYNQTAWYFDGCFAPNLNTQYIVGIAVYSTILPCIQYCNTKTNIAVNPSVPLIYAALYENVCFCSTSMEAFSLVQGIGSTNTSCASDCVGDSGITCNGVVAIGITTVVPLLPLTCLFMMQNLTHGATQG